jgi:hypothetical protein
MVPGAPAPLTRVCIGGDNLLLLYADDRARLWDVKTLEFWRSTNTEKAKELLSQGGWTELSVMLWATFLLKLTSSSRSLEDSSSAKKTPTTLSVFSPDSCMVRSLVLHLESGADAVLWKPRQYWWIYSRS